MSNDPLMRSILAHRERQLTGGMVLHAPSTDDLDLTTLPERLDDAIMERLAAIIASPLLPPALCSEAHLHKCLRVMLSVLPRRNADDVSGELFVAAYQRKLGDLPEATVTFITDRALEQCRWFPTIAELLEMKEDWRRDDEHTRRKNDARALAHKERMARMARKPVEEQWQPTAAELDELKRSAAAALKA